MTKSEEIDAIEEYDIRQWFVQTDLEQARDTFRVVEGIMQARGEGSGRKRRSDAGTKKGTNREAMQESGNSGYPPA